MRFGSIVRYVQQTPWAVTDEKFSDLMDVLFARLSGERFTDAEIQARIGDVMGQHRDRLDAAAATSKASGGVVAVVPIFGTIFHRFAESLGDSSGGTSTTAFLQAFRAAVADPAVGTILLDVNSPGGTAAGVPEVADEVFAARKSKHIVALADDLMASAAYFIASQAHEVVAIPTGVVGSIGVFAAHQDLSERAKLLGIKMSFMSAGKYKLEGNSFEPLSDEGRAQIQAHVDEAYGQFVKAVARGRGVSVADVRAGYGEGRALPAKAALEANLIDRISKREEAIARLVKGAGGSRAEADAIAVEADRRRRLERF